MGVTKELRDLESCLKRQKWRKIQETSKKRASIEAGGLVEEWTTCGLAENPKNR